MAKWFVDKNGQVLGPLTTPQLRQRVAAGELTPGDKVRKEDMANWVRAAAVKGLFDVVAPPVGPAPASTAPAETMAPPAAGSDNDNPFDFFGSGTAPPREPAAADQPELEVTGAFAFDAPAPAAPPPAAPLSAAPTPVKPPKKAKPPIAPTAAKPGIIPAALPVEDEIPEAAPVEVPEEKLAAVAIAEAAPSSARHSEVKIDGPKPPTAAESPIAELQGDDAVRWLLSRRWLLARGKSNDGQLWETTIPFRRIDAITVSDAGGGKKTLLITAGMSSVKLTAAAAAVTSFARALVSNFR